MKKGYIILEIGWEYNDEYYTTGNYGEMYEAPTEVFMDKKLAQAECDKRELESFRGVNLSSYLGEDLDSYLANSASEDDLFKYVKDTFDVDMEDDFYFDIPNKATDEQIKGLMEILTLRFHSLKEITINE